MKKIYFFLLAMCLIAAACKDEEKEQTFKSQEPCHCIMDTLKGEWKWVKTHYDWGITAGNECTSIIKILSSNEDGSMNYEVFVDSTLFYKNSFRIQQSQWARDRGLREANIKLPHFTFDPHSNWYISFGGTSENPDKETLVFWDGGYWESWSGISGFYYYKKIKTE